MEISILEAGNDHLTVSGVSAKSKLNFHITILNSAIVPFLHFQAVDKTGEGKQLEGGRINKLHSIVRTVRLAVLGSITEKRDRPLWDA